MTGSGTLADPYVIWDVNDLQDVELDLTAYYELGGDIDASATSGWNAGAGFLPIGQIGGFTGHFDGKGYAISSLFINRPAADYVGLFSYIEGGTVQNVSLVNAVITGKLWVGTLVGLLEDGVIDNCSSSGSVVAIWGGGLVGLSYKFGATAPTITNSHSTSTVTSAGGANSRVAGFIYDAEDTTITSCYATGNAVNTGSGGGGPATPFMAAGFAVWLINCIVSECYATGDALTAVEPFREAAGFAAEMNGGAISNCYARGKATGGGAAGFLCYGDFLSIGAIDDAYSTGLVTQIGGATDGGFCLSRGATVIQNCFWDTETSGQATSDGGTGKTTAQMKIESTFTDAGWDFTTPIWYISAGTNNGYPAFEEIIVSPTVTTDPATGVT